MTHKNILLLNKVFSLLWEINYIIYTNLTPYVIDKHGDNVRVLTVNKFE